VRIPFFLIPLAVVGVFAFAPQPQPQGNARRGKAILANFNDSLPQFGGNALRCTSCHLDDGRRVNAMSWVGAASRYPRYRARRGAVESLEQRVNECIARSLAGRPLPETGVAMGDIVAYLKELGRESSPLKPDTVRLVGDTVRGAKQYAVMCARCHAMNGRGASAPAVLGPRTYSVGAGLARQTVLATFLRWNMPYDAPGTLAPQDAADIAAWMLRQPRPDHPGKERDWPNGDAPPDVAYSTVGALSRGLPPPPSRPVFRRRVFTTPPPAR
jgi:thiosulfate dehydrogenase